MILKSRILFSLALALVMYSPVITAAPQSACVKYYRHQADRAFAFQLVQSNYTKEFTEKRKDDDLPPTLTFDEFAQGLSELRSSMFKNTTEFLNWKTSDWTSETQAGTQGYKVLETYVAVKLEKNDIRLVPINLFDKEGEHGSHREIAIMAGLAFGEEAITYRVRYQTLYHGQIVVSKFKGENYYEYINTGDYNIRVHAQWYLETDQKMPAAWKRDIQRVDLK